MKALARWFGTLSDAVKIAVVVAVAALLFAAIYFGTNLSGVGDFVDMLDAATPTVEATATATGTPAP